MIPLMLVPLLVWLAVWGYMWALDRKVRALTDELDRREAEEADR